MNTAESHTEQFSGVKPKGVSAAQVSEIFRDLEKRHGQVSPADLVDEAKKNGHPLHGYFEWNDSTAAKLFRIEQAKMLIRSLVRVQDGVKTRAYLNIMSDADTDEPTHNHWAGNKESRYINTEDILAQPHLRKYVLDRAYNELRAFRQKYKNLAELAKIHEAIDEATK